ncbi:MAG: tetratricopeptide repeat protein [Limnospira sp. PMC 1291.21]|uniref:Tetratricopeptide repeat protein n=2 Tax=Limnospira fusiformis TaxID=54297 RepID=A0ABU9EQC1_LIMFS|nr:MULTISPECIES: tetratricopeptide repeat protein [Limnospira]MDT9178067.1 tetratricopeptide repeat protein [Limnospira sp. PMC 1238.20]MDT9193248.1 tetratricopeptide repeat protein [Limnospira sp. PMC 1245.20]MDT9198479.1 tetratricopeptide repeat protein [Limnospira sp. PMC 1042.18]MDT9203552.1 tetratricopeptide repeat protein [Limnospira sp. PMC 1243.20]MDT9208714.1 tetratricopeptide repeat protein [Limnospira sp. PMC 1252.20]
MDVLENMELLAVNPYQQGIEYLTEGKLEEAIACCNFALERQPYWPDGYKTLGLAYQKQGNFEQALIAYTNALEIKPDFAEVYGNLGSLYAEHKLWQDAVQAYDVALRLNPDLVGLYRNLAQLLIMFGKYEDAISYCQQAIAKQPDSFKAYYLLGNALSGLEKWSAAETAYQRGAELNPQCDRIHVDLGNMLAQQGNWQPAIAAYQTAIKINPKNELAYHKLGNSWFRLQEPEKAISVYKKAMEINPLTPWSHLPLGRSLLEVGKVQEAIAICFRAVELNPNSYWAYENLGDALSRNRRFSQAIPIYLQALQKVPEDRPGVSKSLYRQLGYAIREQSQADVDKASQWLSEMINHPPDHNWQKLGLTKQNPEPYLQLGEMLAKNYQFEGAIAFHKLACECQPKNAEILEKYQNICQQYQEFEEKISSLQLATQEDSTSPKPYTELGNLLSEHNRLDEAASYHRTALKLRGWDVSEQRNYRFTRDWFSSNIPTWEKNLHHLAGIPGFQALEVGSFQGMSACWLLDYILTHPTATITCIDPYFQPEFNSNIAQTNAGDRVIKIVGYSQNILNSLAADYYDLIYIDGCHLATVAFRDALLSWRLLKVGGMAIFDDYNVSEEDDQEQEAKRGINLFLEKVKDWVDIIDEGYQLFLVKTGDGFQPGELEMLLSEIDGPLQAYY